MNNLLPLKRNWKLALCTGLVALSLVAASCTKTATTTTTAGSTLQATTTNAPTGATRPVTPTTTTSSATTPATTAVLTIINGATTQTYTLAQLKALPSTTGFGATKNKAGTITGPNSYTGVALTALLKATGGITNGSAVKITAQDGYTKTLSYAQVYQGTFNVYDKTGNPATAGTQPVISLVYAIDGKDLDAATGPVETGIMTASDQATDASTWIKLTNKIEILKPVTLNVAGAASLSNVLKAVDTLYSQTYPNVTISANFASSGALQTQIENGGPVDVFISAAAAQMDNLQKEKLLIDSSRKNLLNNNLVLIVPNNSTLGLNLFVDLTSTKVTKIAIGDPKSVPAGMYAQKAFDELGITTQLQSKFVMGADVTTVLTYVSTGNVDAGLVYSTDALTSNQVKVAAQAPANINSLIVYPAAVIQASKNPDAAQAYINFLFSAPAKALFQQYGFSMAVN